jgi:hypothetical protein
VGLRVRIAGCCYINKAYCGKAIEFLEKAKAGYSDPERSKLLDALIEQPKLQIKD